MTKQEFDEISASLDSLEAEMIEEIKASMAKSNLIDSLNRELTALKKEYDEEVISHDIEEKAWKAQLDDLRAEIEDLKSPFGKQRER